MRNTTSRCSASKVELLNMHHLACKATQAPPLVRLFIFIYIIIASSPPQAATLELLSIAGTGRPVTNQRLRKCGEGAAQP